MAVVDAMLQVLTEQVFTILKEQARFPLDFKDQFELMKTKLDLTKALLADTESLKEKKEVVKASLITLRGLIYEADNIMTDCLVRDEYEKEGSCTSLTFKKPLFWYQTGKKLKDVNSKLDAMERSLGIHLKYQEQSDHGDNTSQVMKYTAQDYARSEHVAAGYDKMIWVSVSQVSSDRRIMRSMLDQLESHCSVSDEAQLLHKLNELLKGKICLIVMDDVWKINQGWWNQFFSGLDGAVGKGSCIIITTRKEDVLTSMGVGRSQFHKPKELTDNDSWLLFRKSAFSSYPDAQFEKIQAEQLIHWWVGEGLIQGKGSKTAKELGYSYLSELVTRCLVEAVSRRGYDGRVYCCKVHDMVRELIIRIAEEESFGKFDEHGRQEMTGDSRWLGFTSEMKPEIFRKSSKLRALLITHIGSLGSLRVLDFSLTKLPRISTEKLMEWISSLKRLAYLNLSGVVGLKELPKSFRKLRNLQFLVFAGCNQLVKIDLITSLKKLVVLDLGSCLLYLPSGIEKLSHLQELSGFNVASNSRSPTGFKFCDLQKLVHLRVLRMSIGKDSEIKEDEREVLLKLEKLKVLAIDAQDCEDNNISTMLNIVSPPPSLRELYLRRYHPETLPTWINPEKLFNLQYMCIENADIIDFQTSPKSVDGSVFRWNIEGLCFKVLRNLKLDWKNLEKDSFCYDMQKLVIVQIGEIL
ncbi:hypothetical protein DKX38_027432 [Salix brachista]|uniref:NB-ARC domain-containing protein n=1 Tax=Salix brachista TaxID=2182728 RepID=A0A5N5JFL0_9ROSI|nr:hypothetical protein DKX38_027432 [Salix brachista]